MAERESKVSSDDSTSIIKSKQKFIDRTLRKIYYDTFPNLLKKKKKFTSKKEKQKKLFKEKSRIDKADNFARKFVKRSLKRSIRKKKKRKVTQFMYKTHALPFPIPYSHSRINNSTNNRPRFYDPRFHPRKDRGRKMAMLVKYWQENDCRGEKSIWSISSGVPSPVSPALRPGRLVGACEWRGGQRCNVDIALYTGRRDAEWGGRGIGESSTWVK